MNIKAESEASYTNFTQDSCLISSSPVNKKPNANNKLLENEVKSICKKLHDTSEELLNISIQELKNPVQTNDDHKMKINQINQNHIKQLSGLQVKDKTIIPQYKVNGDIKESYELEQKFLCEKLLHITPKQLVTMKTDELAFKFLNSNIKSERKFKEMYQNFLKSESQNIKINNTISEQKCSNLTAKNLDKRENELNFLCKELEISKEEFKKMSKQDLAKTFLSIDLGTFEEILTRFYSYSPTNSIKKRSIELVNNYKIANKNSISKIDENSNIKDRTVEEKLTTTPNDDKLSPSQSSNETIKANFVYKNEKNETVESNTLNIDETKSLSNCGSKISTICHILNINRNKFEQMSAEELVNQKVFHHRIKSNKHRIRGGDAEGEKNEIQAERLLDYILKQSLSLRSNDSSEIQVNTPKQKCDKDKKKLDKSNISDLFCKSKLNAIEIDKKFDEPPAYYIIYPDLILNNKNCSQSHLKELRKYLNDNLFSKDEKN